MACAARAARGSFVTILQFLLIRNAAEELNKFHYNYVLYFTINPLVINIQLIYKFVQLYFCYHIFLVNVHFQGYYHYSLI